MPLGSHKYAGCCKLQLFRRISPETLLWRADVAQCVFLIMNVFQGCCKCPCVPSKKKHLSCISLDKFLKAKKKKKICFDKQETWIRLEIHLIYFKNIYKKMHINQRVIKSYHLALVWETVQIEKWKSDKKGQWIWTGSENDFFYVYEIKSLMWSEREKFALWGGSMKAFVKSYRSCRLSPPCQGKIDSSPLYLSPASLRTLYIHYWLNSSFPFFFFNFCFPEGLQHFPDRMVSELSAAVTAIYDFFFFLLSWICSKITRLMWLF